MSQAFPNPPEQPESVSESETGLKGRARTQARFARLVPRRRGTRLAVLGAAVVILAGGAAAAAVAEHHHGEEYRGGHSTEAGARHRGDGEHEKARPGGPGKGGEHGRHGDQGDQGARAAQGPEGFAGRGPAPAPAPLPALPAGQAAEKAAAAVPGGKVENLQVVGQQGGGSAWLAVVLGTDGVRHDVTLAGTDGTVTGNTVANR